MMEPRISNPPEDPPARSENPTPLAMMTPPKILASIGSLVSLMTGMTVRNQVVATTDSMLRQIYFLPTATKPQIRIGKLIAK
ncbi:hypothetical protein D3C80_1957780 [compost metagenome]